MISITRTWRRISSQLKTNLKRRTSTSSSSSGSSTTTKKSVRFYAIDTVYYTHSSTEYDRTPSDEDLSCLEKDSSYAKQHGEDDDDEEEEEEEEDDDLKGYTFF